MSDSKTYEGYVFFVLFNKGSKSEHFAPVLSTEQGVTYQLIKDGDNPFMHETFKPFHAKYCHVVGELNHENNQISVSNITEKPDPLLEVWKNNEPATDSNVTGGQKEEGSDE